MTRLLVHVEGPTEETFVYQVLAPHLYNVGYQNVAARLLGNSRLRSRRGGIRDWNVVKREVDRHLAEDPHAIATTIVDYYALPHSWPGREAAGHLPTADRAQHLQAQIMNDFSATSAYYLRFEPFIVMHEFEALLFSDCTLFAQSIDQADKAPLLQAVRDGFAGPEHINDSPETAPSKRVEGIIPGYRKVFHGNIAASEIGLQRIRAECPHLDGWVQRLEQKI